MRLSIDAFGANGFPRQELAEAIGASFTASAYQGTEHSDRARILLKQYLESMLGVTDLDSGASSTWPIDLDSGTSPDTFNRTQQWRGDTQDILTASGSPGVLMASSAVLCLACSQVSPPNSALANRVAKLCSEKMGVVFYQSPDLPHAAGQICELVAEKVLREITSNMSLLSTGSSSPSLSRVSYTTLLADFIEASIWLLRSAGRHERAIEVARDRLLLNCPQDATTGGRGSWSQIKYESYIATHLSEIWSSGEGEGYNLVLRSPATLRLLESNPRLGLSVFTATHPQNDQQWRDMKAESDPLANSNVIHEVLKLLKSTNPAIPYNKERIAQENSVLPLESGRAMAVSFLESAIGISTNRPAFGFEVSSNKEQVTTSIASFHNELSFLLLEGVISERSDDNSAHEDTALGSIYREKLRSLLKWPGAKLSAETLMQTLPPSFLQERALVLGRTGKHDEALQILFKELGSLDLALQYCDERYSLQKRREEALCVQRVTMSDPRGRSTNIEDNAYLPLVRIALQADGTDKGVAAAIKVLALRRGAIDRASALRLLPSGVPVSAIARPFLIPALVDGESQVRRLTVLSSLFRARYLRLKEELTDVQLKAQADLHIVPQFQNLPLGEPLSSSEPVRARTSATASMTMSDVMIVKHYFQNHLVIQAKVTNTTGTPRQGDPANGGSKASRTLSNITFVVAESSEEAIQPLMQVPIQLLPAQMTGCSWCVLEVAPARIDGSTAQLTCELRYMVLSAESQNIGFAGGPGANMGRSFVEELQDVEVKTSLFGPR